MAYLLDLQSFKDKRGNLTVIEKSIPFDIKRIFYIYGVDKSVRGGHRHKKTIQAAICIQGSCKINYHNGNNAPSSLVLNRPDQCLIIEPADWHSIDSFSDKAILMVLASECFDEKDYIFEPYTQQDDTV